MDRGKDKAEPDEYFHNNIIYKRKFGGYLVWHQILEYAKFSSLKSLIFVTDDGKGDWWWSVKSDGSKTLGPRPELLDEAATVGGLTDFIMYKPDAFLKYANDFLETGVSEATLEEVRDVSEVRSMRDKQRASFHHREFIAERAVYKWLTGMFSSVTHSKRDFPDFIATTGGQKFGYEVKTFSSPNSVFKRLRETILQANLNIAKGYLNRATIVLVAPSFSEAEAVTNIIQRRPIHIIPKTIQIIVGVVYEGSDEAEFVPFRDTPLSPIEDDF